MDWIIILIILAMAWYWWSSATAYEAALQAAKALCRQYQLEFLDDTLVQSQWRLCRHANGYVQFCRQYRFEFSEDGEQRHAGRLWLQGNHITKTELDAYRIGEND